MTTKTIPFNTAAGRKRVAPDFVFPLAESRKDEIEAVVAIACDVIKADQKLDSSTIERLEAFVRSFLDEGGDAQAVVFAGGMIDFYRHHPIDPLWIKRVIPRLSSRICIVLVAFLDGLSNGAQMRCAGLETWRKKLGIGDAMARAIGATAQDPLLEAYSTLGLLPGAAMEAVKRAWRERCKEFHPDLYGHLPPSFQSFARERFQQTAEAYDRIVGMTTARSQVA